MPRGPERASPMRAVRLITHPYAIARQRSAGFFSARQTTRPELIPRQPSPISG